ncbi:MAG: hypothetical protein QXO76_08585 [Thermoproteota archaeon]
MVKENVSGISKAVALVIVAIVIAAAGISFGVYMATTTQQVTTTVTVTPTTTITSPTKPPIKNPDTIIEATIGEPETLDPAWAYDTASGEVIFNIYETLIFFDREKT